MKVICKQVELAEALNVVSRAIGSNSTLPILNNILLEAKGNALWLSATNLEVAIKTKIICNVEFEGSITVPAKLFFSYVNLLSKEDLVLEELDDLSLSVSGSNSETKIKGLKAEDYPTMPEVSNEVSFDVNSKVFSSALKKVVFSCSNKADRPFLAGVYMFTEGNKFYLVATDSYRLSECSIDLDKNVDGISCIVPSKTMGELEKIMEMNPKQNVEVILGQSQIAFRCGETLVLSRLIDGQFPDYKKIIPAEHKTSVSLGLSELQQALKRVSLFAKEVEDAVSLEFDSENEKVFISTQETLIGTDKNEISIAISGESTKISVNSQYLMDVLNVIGDSVVSLQVTDRILPIKVLDKKEPNFQYIIMPLKV